MVVHKQKESINGENLLPPQICVLFSPAFFFFVLSLPYTSVMFVDSGEKHHGRHK